MHQFLPACDPEVKVRGRPCFLRPTAAHFGAVSADNDGKFIVFPFKSTAAKQFVLSVIYRGKVTFHHVAPDEDDQLVINKKSYGEASTIQEVMYRAYPRLTAPTLLVLHDPVVGPALWDNFMAHFV